jgi:hypothetical protein
MKYTLGDRLFAWSEMGFVIPAMIAAAILLAPFLLIGFIASAVAKRVFAFDLIALALSSQRLDELRRDQEP